MPMGRIKRDRSKIARMLPAKSKQVKVTVSVFRSIGARGSVGYRAQACIGDRGEGHIRSDGRGCAFSRPGRTPQAAIAKALKALAEKTGRRGI